MNTDPSSAGNWESVDIFFKKVCESEERQRRLVAFLLDIDAGKVTVANVRPVLFGNKENDFSCICDEVLNYIERGDLPERFGPYDSDMRDYALVANGITYIQRTGNDPKYTVPANISTVAEYLKLMLDRGIFVDLLSDKEVCDMTMAQFSRDDILIYQGREEGIKAFILDKVEDGVSESIIVKKLRKHFTLDEKTARQYCRTYIK